MRSIVFSCCYFWATLLLLLAGQNGIIVGAAFVSPLACNWKHSKHLSKDMQNLTPSVVSLKDDPTSSTFLLKREHRQRVPMHVFPNGRYAESWRLHLSKRTNPDDDDGNKAPNETKIPPGTFIMLPLIALVGLDLLINIAVLTKRTFEFLVLGQAPSTEPWW